MAPSYSEHKLMFKMYQNLRPTFRVHVHVTLLILMVIIRMRFVPLLCIKCWLQQLVRYNQAQISLVSKHASDVRKCPKV